MFNHPIGVWDIVVVILLVLVIQELLNRAGDNGVK